ncbi:MAG: YbhB/YbcL family Raf kinase inhibitor-like protein [Alphaproteobacteria bacterium]|nr:YbhB/YbcL family Raf kinase inhibitor-like protein [Alphaproteobacteria bacterium]
MRNSKKYISIDVMSVAAVTLLLAVPALAQGQNAGDGPPLLANKIAVPSGATARLLVTSGAFTSGSTLNDRYTQNGDNMSPGLTWARGPLGTQSYVVLAEDAGVNRHDPVVHWVVYNIPSTTTTLDQNVPTEAHLENGAEQGKNASGSAGYIGPKPPAGQTHPYHFEVFALNTKLNLDPANADRQAVVNAMKGNVLASGEIVASYTGK